MRSACQPNGVAGESSEEVRCSELLLRPVVSRHRDSRGQLDECLKHEGRQ